MPVTKKKEEAEKKPLEGKMVDSLEEIAKRKEETGTVLVNPFKIEHVKNTAGLYCIKREKGSVPAHLSGMYTSLHFAEIDLNKHLGY